MEITINSEIGEPSRANDQETIRKFTQGELDIIHKQVTKSSEEAKKLLKEVVRGSTSCIYRVLPRLKKINGEPLYEPNLVSIGPYYYKLRNEKFQMAEDCKWKCFGLLVMKDRDLDMQQQINTYKRCLQKISELEEKIRNCYSEEFEVSGIEFLEMTVLDACFIIDTIVMRRSIIIAARAWVVPYCYRDFLLLENQIPFFVLEEIFALTHNISFEESRSKLVSPLLDLVRTSLNPSNIRQGIKSIFKTTFIHCISKHRLAGIKVSQGKVRMSFLEVKFKRGVIEMPNIAIDDLMRCVLLNSVAFEQCHQGRSKCFSVYATFLDCLVNTEEDVEYLRERNIIDNYLTDDSELAGFINRAGKDLVFNVFDDFYLVELFEDVDRHYI
ncbi:hypothetical protein I3842_16G039700 [Carya illinoinensis]|uniref:Uncharacterized protein n=1 Tax=Carya illinoinensis TaxID=32201 RepID=A0A922D0X3_CARIL|nr:hypothetical protein I3842_16G039700 [Carya illinoinensis]